MSSYKYTPCMLMHRFKFVLLFFQQVKEEMGYEDDGQRAELIFAAKPGVVAGQIRMDSQGVQYADIEATIKARRPGAVKTEVSYQDIDHIATKVT